MGAILLAGLGTTLRHGMDAAALTTGLDAPGVDVAAVFRWLFVAGEAFLAAALASLLLMEEHPLRGPEA
jgi:hypothetical protein